MADDPPATATSPPRPHTPGSPPGDARPASAADAENLASAASAAKVPRRGPGRPPKKVPPPPLKKAGIVEKPEYPENCFELAFEDPMIFKSLFSYLKGMKAQNIHFRCTPTAISFLAWDAGMTSRIIAELPGKSMNHYYCDTTHHLSLSRENVEKIFMSIDRTYHKITLLIQADDIESLHIVFKDHEIDKVSDYKVVLAKLDDDPVLFAAEREASPAELATYTVAFTLTAKQFKKTVVDASGYTSSLSFEKSGSHPLQLTYNKTNVVKYREVYHSGEKIGLRSRVGDDEYFKITVPLAHIKPLAAAMVTDTVEILCADGRDLVFRSVIASFSMITLTALERTQADDDHLGFSAG